MGKTIMEIVSSDDVLRAVQMYGPVVPTDVRKILKKGDSITIGASLSQLSHDKHVLVTNVKKGGSPFYYAPGSEAKLDRVSDYLNAKDKQTYEILKKEKVLRDSAQDPLTRVSLRQIKDFSRSFNINVNGQREIFWRYFLVSEPEAVQILRERYAPRKEEIKVHPEQKKAEEQKQEASKQEQKSSEKSKLQTTESSHQVMPKQVATIVNGNHSKQSETKQRTESKLKQQIQKSLTEDYEEEENIFETVQDDFLKRIKSFFDANDVIVKDAKLIRKGSEYNFVIEMKTPMGNAEYFCKAKSKKKSTNGDLSTAYLQGQTRRIPTVYLTTGEVAKKAKEKTSTDYKGMLIKEI